MVALHGLGIIYAQVLSDHEKAISFFTRALEKDETNTDLLFSRGCSFMILKKMNEAQSDLQKAATLGHKKAEEMMKKYFN